jgi:hypothetical protein
LAHTIWQRGQHNRDSSRAQKVEFNIKNEGRADKPSPEVMHTSRTAHEIAVIDSQAGNYIEQMRRFGERFVAVIQQSLIFTIRADILRQRGIINRRQYQKRVRRARNRLTRSQNEHGRSN